MIPDISLLEKIGATSFTVPEAIVELVANSIDARPDDEPLEVSVCLDFDEIAVVDNGVGMEADILGEAVRLGVNMSDFIDRKGRKGMYGLGLKTACASLGKYWEVHTRPEGGDYELRVAFDLEAIQKRVAKGASAWKHSMEKVGPDSDGPLGERAHGTAVIIRRRRDKDPQEGPVLDRLGRAYKPHIEAGDVFRVRLPSGEWRNAAPPQYDLIEGRKFDLDETCGPDGKYRITGWVGLDKKTHNDDYFGLNLYREGQLIEPWNKDWFKVHLMTSRIVGEINLNFVRANFHKKGFEKQSLEWKIATEHMKKVLHPVVQASRTASRGRGDRTKNAKAMRGMAIGLGVAGAVSQSLGVESPDEPTDTTSGDANGQAKGAKKRATKIRVDEATIYLPDGQLDLSYKTEAMDDEETPWSYVHNDVGANELLAILNSSSHAFRACKDEQFLGILALSDAVAQFLTVEKGLPSDDARRIRNRWLAEALQGMR